VIVETFVACDFAQDTQGKLTVVGAFDTITADAVPATHPFMCVATRIRFMIHELGRHEVTVEFLDPEGKQVAPPFKGSLDVSGLGTDSVAADLVLNHVGVRFGSFGKHEIRLLVDGEPRASAPVHVRRKNRPS